ncbi:MAG: hypothetical protein QXT45_04340 [Candidatus Bilamarchaeaceae archaeon]
MAETLVVTLDLDDEKFRQAIENVTQDVEDSGDRIKSTLASSGQDASKQFTSAIESLSKTINGLTKTIKDLSNRFNSLSIDDSQITHSLVVIDAKTSEVADTTKLLTGNYKTLGNESLNLTSAISNQTRAIDDNIENVTKLSHALNNVHDSSRLVSSSYSNSSNAVGGLTKSFNALSVAVKAAVVGFGSFIIIDILRKAQTDSVGLQKLIIITLDLAKAFTGLRIIAGDSLGSFTSSVLTTGAVVSSIMSFVIIRLFMSATNVVSSLGNAMVTAGQKAYEAFLEFRKGGLIFEQIISAFQRNTKGAIGTTDEWMQLIRTLSSELNLGIDSLQKASAEIVQVGSRLGLTKSQMQNLLRVVAEYARLMGKDVFDASVAFLQALQGQSSAVLSYGVKLTEAATAQYALKNGLRQSFNSLSESEKLQIRYNFLLSQFADVSGVAVQIANDWFAQNEKLKITLASVNAEIGKGAAIIHDFNLFAGLANRALSAISPTILQLLGFFGSLGGYLLKTIGIGLKFILIAGLIRHNLHLINLVLASQWWGRFVNEILPRMGFNITQVAKGYGLAAAEVNSLGGIFRTLLGIITSPKFSLIEFITGIRGATSASSLLAIVIQRIISGLEIMIPIIGRIVLAMAPMILKATLITGAIYLVARAFEEVERRTQVFSTVFAKVTDAARNIVTIASEMRGVFDVVLSGIIEGFNRLLGLVVFVISNLVTVSLKLVELFIGAFGKRLPAEIEVTVNKLKTLNESLLNSGFKLDEVAKGIRDIASEGKKADFSQFERLNEILRQISDERMSDVQRIAATMRERLSIIQAALRAEVLSVREAEDAKSGAIAIAQQRTSEILRGLLARQSAINNQIIVDEYNRRQKIINDALNNSLISEESYRQYTLQNQQIFNEQMEQLYQQHAASKLSEAEQIAIAYGVTVRHAEAALNAMQQITGAMMNIIAGGMERIGASLVMGGSAFDDFGKFVLNILGDLAIQIGVLMTGLGTALQKLAAALANPFLGASVVIAGLALIAIGGLLKALANVRPSTTGPVASPPLVPDRGGGITPAPIPGPVTGIAQNELLPRPDAERDRPGEQINIVVEGNIFNTEETGRTLIDLLSREFNKRGARIVKRGFA